jgi:hypothetical protein
MPKLKVVVEVDWDYCLYRSPDGFLLSVVCDTAGVDELNIPVSADDAKAIQEGSLGLVERMRKSPREFLAQHVDISQADLL